MLRAKLKATVLLIVIFVNVVELGGKRTRGFPSKREGFPLGESISAEVSPCATQCPRPAGTPRGVWSPTWPVPHAEQTWIPTSFEDRVRGYHQRQVFL